MAASMHDEEFLKTEDDGVVVSRPLMADRDVAMSIAAVERVLARHPDDTDSEEEVELQKYLEQKEEATRQSGSKPARAPQRVKRPDAKAPVSHGSSGGAAASGGGVGAAGGSGRGGGGGGSTAAVARGAPLQSTGGRSALSSTMPAKVTTGALDAATPVRAEPRLNATAGAAAGPHSLGATTPAMASSGASATVRPSSARVASPGRVPTSPIAAPGAAPEGWVSQSGSGRASAATSREGPLDGTAAGVTSPLLSPSQTITREGARQRVRIIADDALVPPTPDEDGVPGGAPSGAGAASRTTSATLGRVGKSESKSEVKAQELANERT